MHDRGLAVLARYSEPLDWAANLSVPFVVLSKGDSIPNRGHEASTFLHFIVQRYDSLPTWTLFLHAHERSFHVGSNFAAADIDMHKTGLGFLNVNFNPEDGHFLLYTLGNCLRGLSLSEMLSLKTNLLSDAARAPLHPLHTNCSRRYPPHAQL